MLRYGHVLLPVARCERWTSLPANAVCGMRANGHPRYVHAGAGMLAVAAAVGTDDFPRCRHGRWRRGRHAARRVTSLPIWRRSRLVVWPSVPRRNERSVASASLRERSRSLASFTVPPVAGAAMMAGCAC